MRKPFLAPQVVLVSLLLVAAGCGTRKDHADVVAASRQGSASTGTGAAASSSTGETSSAPSGDVGAAAPVTTAAGGSASGAAKQASSAARTAGGGTGTRGTSGGGAGPVAGNNGSVVSIGSVGTLSGPAGDVLYSNVEGVQAWTKAVNDRGGVKGHHVRLLVQDDAADPARHRAQVQQLVEQENVVAFVNNAEPLSGQPSVDYITAKRVPVIGGSTGESWFYTSPMYFPQASSGAALLYAAIASTAQQAIARGKHKLALITCQEAQFCRDADRDGPGVAQKLGLQVVYKGRASLAQPDFTAECLSARNAGAEIFQVVLDTNSIGRVAAACGRQAFRPIFAFGASLVADRQKDDLNLDSAVASSNVFPYFQSGTPAADEFRAAMRRYAPSVVLGVGHATGWTSGKLFERAAAAGDPTTSAGVLRGLWTIKNDTLGGLTQQLTFVENKPAVPVACWFNLTIRSRQWVSADNFKLNCQ